MIRVSEIQTETLFLLDTQPNPELTDNQCSSSLNLVNVMGDEGFKGFVLT